MCLFFMCVSVSMSMQLCVCARVLSTTASQSNGAAPSGPNTWARLFNPLGEECSPEGCRWLCLCLCVWVCVWTRGTVEAVTGQPKRVRKPAPVTGVKIVQREFGEKRRDTVAEKGGERDKRRKRWRYWQQNEETERRRNELGGFVYLPLSLLCAWWITTTWSRPNCIMWQLLAAVEKADQFGFSFRCSPAMLPMTPQNIQLLGSTEGAGGHRKKRIVALQNKDCSP